MSAYPGTSGKTISFAQIKQLWLSNGGNPSYANIMAAIAIAESGGMTNNLNDNPGTGDYSVGLWQINYYNGLLQSRTARFGDPASLAGDPNAQAKAAIALQTARPGLGDWQGDAAWKAWNASGAPVPWTPPTSLTGGTPAGSDPGSQLGGLLQGGGQVYDAPGGGASSSSPDSSSPSTGPSGCAVKFPGVAGAGSFCIISNSELKALKAGLCVYAGGVVFMIGAVILAAYGFQRSGASRAVSTVGGAAVKASPGGRVASVAAERVGARAPASRAPRVATGPRPLVSASGRQRLITRQARERQARDDDDLFERSRGSGRANRAGYRRAMRGDTSDLRRATA